MKHRVEWDIGRAVWRQDHDSLSAAKDLATSLVTVGFWRVVSPTRTDVYPTHRTKAVRLRTLRGTAPYPPKPPRKTTRAK